MKDKGKSQGLNFRHIGDGSEYTSRDTAVQRSSMIVQQQTIENYQCDEALQVATISRSSKELPDNRSAEAIKMQM